MVASKQSTTTARRALLTDREREIISGDADVSDSYRYQTISRVRARMDRLAGDLEALEAHGDLADEFREAVCGDAPDTQPPTDGRDPAEERSNEQADQTDAFDSDDLQGDADTTIDDLTDREGSRADVVESVAEAWEDTPDRLDARKAAARAVLEYAREHGSVSKKEAKEQVEPNHPVEGQNARTWYRNNIRPVLNEAAEYDDSERAYRLTAAGSNNE